MPYQTRNRWKKGDWLVIDEESGMTRYASQVMQDYRGLYVTQKYADYEHPQDYVRALNDPIPVPFTNMPDDDFHFCNAVKYYVGETSVRTAIDFPAFHLYNPGIGEMEIGCSFVVH